MSSKTVIWLNEKGGVGKTTGSTNLAAWLAIQGYRVVLVDASAQGHASLTFNLPPEPCFYDLVVRNARWQDVLRLVPPERYCVPDTASDVTGTLLICPGNIETRGIAGAISDTFIALRRFSQLAATVDFIIVDTAPEPTLLHTAL